jgi:hypothetical protein
MKSGKKALQALLACKAEGICERDKILNVYLAKRIEVYERRMQSVNEVYRDENCLPRCPPVCDDKDVTIIENTEIVL